jgi:cell division septal protein FtsQ
MKRTRKMRLPPFMKTVKEAAFGRFAGFFIAAVLLVGIVFSVMVFINGSDYFRLKYVEAKSLFFDQKTAQMVAGQILNAYRARNIFGINLSSIAATLKEAYPDAREVVARIALPDKIVVTLKFRKPIALVRDGLLYPIDEEGFVLPSMDVGSLKDLPVVEGVDIRAGERKGGQNRSRNMALSIELLKEMRTSRALTRYGVSVIDARDLKNMSFNIRSGTKVIIGNENFSQRLELLDDTLKNPRLALDRIDYIDVRFEDAVIGPK